MCEISLYNAFCEINKKLNEVIKRVNSIDPGSETDIVNSVNGETGDVILTGDNINYSANKTVNAKIDENSNKIETVKNDLANLTLENVLGESSAQIQIMTQTAFNAANTQQWNDFYSAGFRIVGVLDETGEKIKQIYLQNTSEPHTPIPLTAATVSAVTDVNGLTGSVTLTGANINVSADDSTRINAKIESIQNDVTSASAKAESALTKANAAYSPSNVPPYPVTSVNGKTGAVTVDSGGSKITVTKVIGTVDYLGSYTTTATPNNFVNIVADSIANLLVPGWSAQNSDGKVRLIFYNLGGATPGQTLDEGSTVSFWLITHS